MNNKNKPVLKLTFRKLAQDFFEVFGTYLIRISNDETKSVKVSFGGSMNKVLDFVKETNNKYDVYINGEKFKEKLFI